MNHPGIFYRERAAFLSMLIQLARLRIRHDAIFLKPPPGGGWRD